MPGVTGYILILNRNRRNLLNESIDRKLLSDLSKISKIYPLIH